MKKEKKLTTEFIKNLWNDFALKYNLNENQLSQFKKYAKLLQERNEDFNLTAIIKIDEIIHYHFEDSLIVENFIDFKSIKSICDVGTGAGFPGIPLKIKYPHLNLFLIEVNFKKINFLEEVVSELNIENVEINSLDWRTFLRKTSYSIDLFLARASLHPDELIRMFKPSCLYNDKKLIYWASINWQANSKENGFIQKQEIYKVGNKKRKLIFLANQGGH